MNPIVIALSLAAQALQPQPQAPLREDLPPRREMSPAHNLYYNGDYASSPEARAANQRFGACVARRSAELASNILSMDFTTPRYRAGLRRLVDANEDCFRLQGRRMRTGNLLIAGAIAEELLERDPQPLNVRLARAATRPAIMARAPSDHVAICVVRSLPDEVSRLFATDAGGPAEEAAIRALEPAVQACAPQNRQVRANNAGLRAMLATAAFRTLRGATATAQRD